jgi:hypothetical protein
MKHTKLFEEFINKETINESSTYFANYYRYSNKDVKDIAKKIDTIIVATISNVQQKNELLDLITDLTDAYHRDMRGEE